MIRRDRRRELVAERTAALARRGTGPVGPAQEGAAFLVCACGSARYGIPLASVAQVLPDRPCTPVPGVGTALRGLIALSGRIVGVVGLARALGRPADVSDRDDHGDRQGHRPGGHLVLLRGAAPLALAVDRVLGVARATDPAAATSDPDGLGNEAAAGYADAADGNPAFVTIDLAGLLRRIAPSPHAQ